MYSTCELTEGGYGGGNGLHYGRFRTRGALEGGLEMCLVHNMLTSQLAYKWSFPVSLEADAVEVRVGLGAEGPPPPKYSPCPDE